MGLEHEQNVMKSLEGEDLNAKIEKLADAEQESHLRKTGQALDRNEARSRVMKANPQLAGEFIQKSYK